MAKTIAIIGATGTQGSSVAHTLLDSARDSWTVRALVRNPSSKAAQALSTKGAELVEADLDDPDSLRAAFADCHAVFALTDFFVPFAANGANAAEAIELEWRRASNVADAVSATPSVEHFVWSTLPHAGRISGGRLHPAHFVAKNRLDDRIKNDPDLFRRTTFLWVGWYATNFIFPVFAPTPLETSAKSIQLGPIGADVPIASIGDPQTNLGPFVLAILQQPATTLPGRFVLAATEAGSMAKFVAAWSDVTGKEAVFVKCAKADFERLWPGWGKVEGDMLEFYEGFGARVAGSEESILTAAELGVALGGMKSIVDTIRDAIAERAQN